MRSKIILTAVVISMSLLAMALTLKTEQNVLFGNVPYFALSKPAQKQVQCLAENMYFEAAHEPDDGKIAVALVTLNRLVSGNYADDICGVVTQKTGNTCQFSWYCEPTTTAKRLTIKHTPLYNEIQNLAVYVLMNYERMPDVTHGATYYHADYVRPGWKLPVSTKIGRHIFYKSNKDLLATESKEIRI